MGTVRALLLVPVPLDSAWPQASESYALSINRLEESPIFRNLARRPQLGPQKHVNILLVGLLLKDSGPLSYLPVGSYHTLCWLLILGDRIQKPESWAPTDGPWYEPTGTFGVQEIDSTTVEMKNRTLQGSWAVSGYGWR